MYVSRPEWQKSDIAKYLEFLEEVGAPRNNWVTCYPYGIYKYNTLLLLKKLGASSGITTNALKAELSSDNPFTLPWMDTNDFPQ